MSITRECWNKGCRTVKTILAMCILVILSTVPLFMFVGKNFLPADDQSQFINLFGHPEGTLPAADTTIAEQIAADGLPVARRRPHAFDRWQQRHSSVNSAAIYVKLTDPELRSLNQTGALMQRTRELLKVLRKRFTPGWN